MRRLIALVVAAATFSVGQPTPVHAWSSSQRCSKYEQLFRDHAPRGGWDVRRMSYISWRESRCQPAVVNTGGGDTGLFQIHPVTWRWLANKFGITYSYGAMRRWLQDPVNNTKAAAALCTFWRNAGRSCYQPWST